MLLIVILIVVIIIIIVVVVTLMITAVPGGAPLALLVLRAAQRDVGEEEAGEDPQPVQLEPPYMTTRKPTLAPTEIDFRSLPGPRQFGSLSL